MSVQEKELVKTEKDSCSTGVCSTGVEDKILLAKQAIEQKQTLEQKTVSEKGGGCCG